MGFKVERQTYQVGGKDCHNIEVQITGKSKPDEIVVIGAHYDSVIGTPGRTTTRAVSRRWSASPTPSSAPSRSGRLRFVGFANEEPPHFQTSAMGSYVYAKRCKERKEKIVAMLSLESLAYYSDEKGSQDYPPTLSARYPDTGNFAAVVGNLKSKALIDQVAAQIGGFGGWCPVEKLILPRQPAGRRLVRPLVVLGIRLQRRHGHRYRSLPEPALPPSRATFPARSTSIVCRKCRSDCAT